MSTLALIVEIRIQPENVDQFMALARENGRAARETEPGCRAFDILVDPEDPTRVTLYEVYDNKTAFEAHQRTAHFKRYLDHAVPLLASRERRFWTRVAP